MLALAVVLPGANYEIWDGLPLDSLAGPIAAVLIAPFLISGKVRSDLGALLGRVHPKALGTALVLVAAVLVIKVALLAWGGYYGFQACYASPVAPPQGLRCERSYANLFDRYGGATRIDKTIDFGPPVGSPPTSLNASAWELSFFNDERFNYLTHDFAPSVARSLSTGRMPLSAHWSGVVESPPHSIILVRYVGQGAIRLGSVVRSLPPSYHQPRQVRLEARGGKEPFELTYAFQPSAIGPYAAMRVTTLGRAGSPSTAPLLRAASPSALWRYLAVGGDVGVGALLCLLALAALRALGREGCLALVATAAFGWLVLKVIPYTPHRDAAAFGLWVLVLLVVRPRRPGLVAWYGLVFLCALHPPLIWSDVGAVVYRQSGDDWLTYESEARSILTGSLRGGENIFGQVPAWRYLLFLERSIFGDGDVLRPVFSYVTVNVALIGFVLWVTPKAKALRLRIGIATIAALIVVLLNSTDVRILLGASASESPTWALIPLLITLPFLRPKQTWPWVVGPAAAGLTMITRPNQGLAAILLLAAFGLAARPSQRRALAIGGLLCVLVLLVPFAHDAIYGHRFHLIPANAATRANLPIPPSRLLHLFSDAQVREGLKQHAEAILDLTGPAGEHNRTLALILHTLLLSWLATCVVAVTLARRSLTSAQRLVMALPAAYLLPHLLYVINDYYPRHIIAGYLAMACVTIGAAGTMSLRPVSERKRTWLGRPVKKSTAPTRVLSESVTRVSPARLRLTNVMTLPTALPALRG